MKKLFCYFLALVGLTGGAVIAFKAITAINSWHVFLDFLLAGGCFLISFLACYSLAREEDKP